MKTAERGPRRRTPSAPPRRGLLDVAYTTADSPFGTLLLARPRAAGAGGPAEPGRRRAARRPGAAGLPPRPRSPGGLDEVRRELDLYFEGACTTSTCRSTGAQQGLPPPGAARDRPHPLRPDPQLHADGDQRRQRARGPGRRHACGCNPIPLVVPCHRVLRSGGGLGGYGGGLPMKEALLRKLEGAREA